jgi:hypothetical protein
MARAVKYAGHAGGDYTGLRSSAFDRGGARIAPAIRPGATSRAPWGRGRPNAAGRYRGAGFPAWIGALLTRLRRPVPRRVRRDGTRHPQPCSTPATRRGTRGGAQADRASPGGVADFIAVVRVANRAAVKLSQNLPAARLANGLGGEIGSGAGALAATGGAFAPFSRSVILPAPLRGSAFPPGNCGGPSQRPSRRSRDARLVPMISRGAGRASSLPGGGLTASPLGGPLAVHHRERGTAPAGAPSSPRCHAA